MADGMSEEPIAVGANCGVGASDILASLLEMSGARPDANLIVKGNCGIPEFHGDQIHYSGTPELMADYVRLAVDAGAKIIGGCCGTSFEHLRSMRQALDAHCKSERPSISSIVETIGTDAQQDRGQFEQPAAPGTARQAGCTVASTIGVLRHPATGTRRA